jgi:DNA-binding MarR family transcriptional regulator
MRAANVSLPEDLQKCLVLNTIAAARSLTRRYDTALRPYGVTVQQFSLLAAIRFNPEASVAVLAKRVHLDRTSLTRNLDLLERKRLIRRVHDPVGGARLCELTDQGNSLLSKLLPEWRIAQAELMSGLADNDASFYLSVVRHMSRF